MTKARRKLSKSLIYIPLFVGATVMLNWWLYSELSFSKVRIASTPMNEAPAGSVELATDEKQDGKSQACVAEIKSLVGGVFQIAPLSVMQNAVTKGGNTCGDQLCAEVNQLKDGRRSIDQFYALAESTDPCLNALLNTAIEQHASIMESRPVHIIFYNDGESRMSASQLTELLAFLQKSVNKSTDQLLLIGRSNPSGSEAANHDLSRLRAEELIEKIKIKFSPSIRTDFIYFGDHPPRITFEMADALGISPMKFRNLRFPGSVDPDFSLRLNQSVVILPYSKENSTIQLL